MVPPCQSVVVTSKSGSAPSSEVIVEGALWYVAVGVATIEVAVVVVMAIVATIH